MNKIFKILIILSAASLVCFAQARRGATNQAGTNSVTQARQGSTNQAGTNSAQVKPNSTTKNIVELTQRGAGKKVGTITVTETADGISIEVKATGLTAKAGQVGFHLHEKNSTRPTRDANGNTVVGGGLGGHWDPDNTQKHAGPNGNGHRGDLDALTVNADGSINQTVVSSKIKYSDIAGKSFVIHENPDNYTDNPANGGSGARLYVAIF